VARIIADLDGGDGGNCLNVAEALFYQRLSPNVRAPMARRPNNQV
tara:strand:- start:389 stop:523 length:135 start_codon:yes stop_codon:yes gene_type:complete